ncbi:GNAT family N-acetyltransferase [Rhizobium oryzicola]|uniref:GNAT family protein n=1 Tax=Rhizobium oryzicola TaxID=1232668 RepID=A0ABT8SWK8_9HYPH|nr:GNAT family protein [Rhizobium oryzicola]MDO1582823.1 GNAT family protein [Rhizobium oryzicola]
MNSLSLRMADDADIDLIMAIERLPGYPELVGAHDVAVHRHKMSLPHYRYVIGELATGAVGFAVIKQEDNGKGIANLNRIAVRQSGKGLGTRFLLALTDLVFADPHMERLWLDVLPDNDIARHVYSKIGFVEEGLMRSALRFPDGRRADLLLMSLLRAEWLQARGSARSSQDLTV